MQAQGADPDTLDVTHMTTLHANIRSQRSAVSILIDTGSPKNCAGDEWAKHAETQALQAGQKCRFIKRAKPLEVEGVGHGGHTCIHDIKIRGAIPLTDGDTAVMKWNFIAPVIPNSPIPALLGLSALKELRTLIDCRTMELHFLGPDDRPLQLPTGTQSVQTEISATGHMLMPFAAYERVMYVKQQQSQPVEVPRAPTLEVGDTVRVATPSPEEEQ